MAIMRATMPSMRSVDLSLAGLRLPAGCWATATLAAHSVQRHYAICTKTPPSLHEADDHTGACQGWRLAASCSSAPATGKAPGLLMLFKVVAIQASERWTWEMRNASMWPLKGSAMAVTCPASG